jgi:AcrR family transcriptional regulator
MKQKAQEKKKGTDRVSTQEKILAAATKVFAEHGFREATTRMICAEAKVNVALVNYYFRSKAELYKAVIAALFENTGKPLMAIPDAVTDAASWQRAVRAWVARSLAICAARKPPELWVARLIGIEECVPSELAQDIEEKFKKPVRQCFERVLRMAMKTDDPVEVNLWASTISAQSMIYALTKQGWAARFCPSGVSREEWLERVADHICAGIFARLSFQRRVE